MANLDHIFSALSDSTRRAVVEQLTRGPANVSELAASHAMALPSFLKHLKVLEGAQLIVTRKDGRVRICQLNPDTVADAQHWLERQRKIWDTRLDQLDSFVETLNRNERKP